jgi:phospholipid/cholesterol/gamma-HCH transport system ATP-binding protein
VREVNLLIRVENVYKRYKGPVLRGLSIDVPSDCIYALIGPGASGKSILFKIIAGLVVPEGGKVFVDGEEITGMDPLRLAEVRKKIGMLFQNYALFDIPVGENIAFPLRRLFELPENEVVARVAERLTRVALPGFEDRMPSSLSGGQKKRIGVARATVAKPPIILYDEPTAGLDPVTSQKIYDLIREEQRAQKTCAVVISSDVQGVLTIADRVGMILNGRMIFDGSVEAAKASQIPAVKQFVHGLTEGPL